MPAKTATLKQPSVHPVYQLGFWLLAALVVFTAFQINNLQNQITSVTAINEVLVKKGATCGCDKGGKKCACTGGKNDACGCMKKKK
jgi:hypothetical protein